MLQLKASYKSFVEKFFGRGEFENVISILEVPIYPSPSLDVHHDKYGELSGYLVAYAVLIYQCISGEK